MLENPTLVKYPSVDFRDVISFGVAYPAIQRDTEVFDFIEYFSATFRICMSKYLSTKYMDIFHMKPISIETKKV